MLHRPAVNERAPRRWIWAVVALVPLIAGGAYFYERLAYATDPRICTELAKAHIAKVVLPEGTRLRCEGVEAHAVQGDAEAALLDAATPDNLLALMRKHKAMAVAVVPGMRHKGVGGQLAKLAHVPGLSALALAPEVALYMPERAIELGSREREALTHLARALLRGAREPSLSSFPPSLRRVERVEVMVALAAPNGTPLLWRSARATSIPRALLTAARVARDRWHEREATLGGPLRERLTSLDVTVSLLVEDGTLTSTNQPFVDKAITSAHGLGFDYRSDWHYFVPADVPRRGRGSAHRALTELCKDSALGMHIFTAEGARLYRFLVQQVGVSHASAQEP
jgi:hypothetical protein